VNSEQRRKHRIASRKYYYANRDKVRARVKAWKRANAERDAETKRKWYLAHLDEQRAKARECRRKWRLKAKAARKRKIADSF
jgi:hypothetical protein